MFRCLIAALFFSCLPRSDLSAAELRIRQLALPGSAVDLTHTEAGVLVRSDKGETYLYGEDGEFRIAPAGAWPEEAAPLAPPMVRDGRVARSSAFGLSAWYAEETEQYRHGALGDPIEALALAVLEVGGMTAIYRMAGDEVFEDLEPRIVDLDGEENGRPEIVTITASANEGAAIAVFGIGRDSTGAPTLVRLATSSRIGSAYRWLNIAGIADFDGDGFIEIAYVDRPHIRGELVFLEWRGVRLREQEREGGFANHHGGSTVQGLSLVADIDGDGHPDLLVPDRGYRHLLAVGLEGDGLREIARVKLPGVPVSAFGRAGIAAMVYLDEAGRPFEVRWEP
ncbi:VCBS repeat-containing protein [Nisaea acidiphila]|uniref:VCBS repeat-containing protein n=1 Tax=Nisaea acidiphila TaxID=1862145 RepID=A0A9J7ARU2_9PROT|nr:VCBS repeat-containing protein [Nisaea acidiphila]UUX50339.1 VCBS repeat-containing protein [Nisaea acidiphila]